jgi:hypothetical protein
VPILKQTNDEAKTDLELAVADRLLLDLSDLDVQGIAIISGGDEIASLTSGHAIADLAATCCCYTSSCCPIDDFPVVSAPTAALSELKAP